jgi:hypothetical protein
MKNFSTIVLILIHTMFKSNYVLQNNEVHKYTYGQLIGPKMLKMGK